MIATINTILRPAHLTAYGAGAILVLAFILARYPRRGVSAPAGAHATTKRSSAWAALLGVAGCVAAYIYSQGKHAPAAAAPKPPAVRTQIIRQVTTRVVSHSPLNGAEIVIIAVVLAGSCVAIWVNRRSA